NNQNNQQNNESRGNNENQQTPQTNQPMNDKQLEQLLQGLRTQEKNIQQKVQSSLKFKRNEDNNDTKKGYGGYKDW
ncbi:MAG: hypothetical protein N2Z72_04975, partial [Bacteroidales bacterium]|nr:hypothetical protein [Bacteroidales bacterium]